MTDDYTPSMKEIRADWVTFRAARESGVDAVSRSWHEFDRAIAAEKAKWSAEIAAEILSHQGEIAAGTWYSAITYAARIAEGTL